MSLKILRVIPSVDPAKGGPVEGIYRVSPVLKQWGHHTEIVSLDQPSEPWVIASDIPVHAVGPGLTGYCFSWELVQWIQSHAAEFDCVIIHGTWQFTSFGAWLALRKQPTPYFLYLHGMLDPWFQRTYPVKHIKKTLYWWLAEQHVLRDAAAVLLTCEQEKVLARQSFWPYRCQERVVTYGTSRPDGDPETQRQLFRQAFPELVGRRLLLFLGRLHVKKGCDILIQAFAQVAQRDPLLHLVLAGPNQTGWQEDLQTMATALGVASQVSFIGMVTGDLKWGAVRSAEVLVLPSHQENFGIAVVEALACGIPVLISDQVNIWQEIVIDGAGLSGPDTLEGTHKMLTRWLDLSPAAQQQMRQLAQACFDQRYEIEKVAHSLITTIEAAISPS